jgi:hypothetical protein
LDDRVILSRDAFLDAGDVVLKTVAHSGALDEGAGYSAAATVTIPTGYSMSEGEYFLFVDTEAGKAITEAVEANNATSSPIHLEFPPHVVFWDGGGDGVSWDDSNNWTRNTLPGAEDTVTIDAPGLAHDGAPDGRRHGASADPGRQPAALRWQPDDGRWPDAELDADAWPASRARRYSAEWSPARVRSSSPRTAARRWTA